MEFSKPNEDSFGPTPKLNSSPVPISFVSFNENDVYCFHCGNIYTKIEYSDHNQQRYCKKCLLSYLTNITDKEMYLDVYIFTKDLECSEHETRRAPQNIQECCKNCLEILCFKQIPVDDISTDNILIDDISTDNNLIDKIIENCYLISVDYIKSTLTKTSIPIIYLPWWNNVSKCNDCKLKLKFTSDCQKYCENCLTFYTGCRYCLTTNIIFGITNQSQCKKCKRVSSIIFDNAKFKSGNSELDDFLINLRLEIHKRLKITEFVDELKNINAHFLPNSLIHTLYNNITEKAAEISMEWIPYSQFVNVKKIARGGYGTIYQAIWLDGSIDNSHKMRERRERRSNETVILKKFNNSQGISKYFLQELQPNQHCYVFGGHIIRIYGFTKDPKVGDYILVMQYASGGDLHNYLQKKFTEIKWDKEKLSILWQIAKGLDTVHNAKFTHRDLHSGNMLIDLSFDKAHRWHIEDLGLSRPISNIPSDNEIYGVIPYIAPEIFKGSAFSKESDIYCVGMIMWELTTGCKPFANVEHDTHLVYKILDGERPKITEDTPECYVNLMKRCWDPDPKKRPTIKEIRPILSKWYCGNMDLKQFKQAEIKRKELIALKKLGPKFCEKPHPSAIYTSRPLRSFISSCSSYSSKGYTSIEHELDIDIKSTN
ncbi:hypothetical protein RclHR1_07580004 [Rhizophagus clarus]|uniref:Kinase-like domain-containing protein n=1 Tax=Rhizophagus clarus TaxID=94130 RepID=A0A2Z6RXA4_9GLOM|nr:hypothetical protein RclHR1_07580004 [Rhizophagus clarus]GES81583.1 kinase-like domain-containing protein [Rhizophagus clarus]